MALRLLLADDHPIFRAGVRSLLEAEPDVQVVQRRPELRAPGVVVSGTVWHPRAERREVELVGGDGGARRLREGDALDDYTIVEITPSAVVFGRGGQVVRLGIGER